MRVPTSWRDYFFCRATGPGVTSRNPACSVQASACQCVPSRGSIVNTECVKDNNPLKPIFDDDIDKLEAPAAQPRCRPLVGAPRPGGREAAPGGLL